MDGGALEAAPLPLALRLAFDGGDVRPGPASPGCRVADDRRRVHDAAAAHNQHERNLADEGASGSNEAQPELGNVTAGLVQHDADSVLLTSVDRFTLDLGLPPLRGPLPPADLLTDLARRVLARLPPVRSDVTP